MQLIELRSGQGYPTYRAVARAMHDEIAEVHPAIAGAMKHLDTSMEPASSACSPRSGPTTATRRRPDLQGPAHRFSELGWSGASGKPAARSDFRHDGEELTPHRPRPVCPIPPVPMLSAPSPGASPRSPSCCWR